MPKFAAANVVRDLIRVEIQIVEEVVGVNSELDLGVFAKYWHVGQAEGLGQCKIHILISRKVERVALRQERDWGSAVPKVVPL